MDGDRRQMTPPERMLFEALDQAGREAGEYADQLVKKGHTFAAAGPHRVAGHYLRRAARIYRAKFATWPPEEK